MKRQDAKTPEKRELPEPDEELDALAAKVVDSALEVHRQLGPGFIESVYQHAMSVVEGHSMPWGCSSTSAFRYFAKE